MSWVFEGPTPSRVEPAAVFLAAFFTAIVFLAVGLFPGYVFEMDGRMDAAERCPPTYRFLERGYDPGCVAEIAGRGPLYLGRAALAVSFVLGAVAIAYWPRVSRSRAPRAAAVAVGVVYVAAWSALLAWNAAEGDRLVRDGFGFVT